MIDPLIVCACDSHTWTEPQLFGGPSRRAWGGRGRCFVWVQTVSVATDQGKKTSSFMKAYTDTHHCPKRNRLITQKKHSKFYSEKMIKQFGKRTTISNHNIKFQCSCYQNWQTNRGRGKKICQVKTFLVGINMLPPCNEETSLMNTHELIIQRRSLA